MSALFTTPRDEPGSADPDHEGHSTAAGTPVVVRRRAGLAALIGATASAVAIAYLWRASQTMAPLDWSLCALMALVAAYYLASLVDARTPLALADDLGVRIRLGDEWRGLPWDAIGQVSVHPRRGRFRDGRIVFTPNSVARAVEGLEGKAKRQARLNQKMYGAVLAVPVGLTTQVSTSDGHGVAEQITALASGRADVVDVAAEVTSKPKRTPKKDHQPEVETPRQPKGKASRQPKSKAPREPEAKAEQAPEPDSRSEEVPAPGTTSTDEPAPALRVDAPGSPPDDAEGRPAGRRMLGGIATIVSRVPKRPRTTGTSEDVDRDDVPLDPAVRADEEQPARPPTGRSAPLRTGRPAVRAEVTREAPATPGSTTPASAGPHQTAQEDDVAGVTHGSRELERAGSVNLVFEPAGDGGLGRVRPISRMGDPVDALVVDDFVTEPAYDPVIGPELTAARTRLGLSVDELAERTRIRPHVIESIEVDDFAPCGGDFYARGHLRTLARVLGTDPAPLLTTFDERYATAPINARRVFEAELATGMRGSMRSTVGGPNWGLLIGVVLALLLVWGVVRFFSAAPAELVQNPTPVLNGSAGLESDPGPRSAAPVAEPIPVTLLAAHGATEVIVRDENDRIVYSGELSLGARKQLRVIPPVQVRATDAGALEVLVRGQDKGVLGVLGQSGSRRFP